MPREWAVQVEDILSAVARVRKYVEGYDFAAFTADEKTQDAVIRNLEVIGEAARALPDAVKGQAAEVEWRKLVGLRNLLIHQYFGVNLFIVWDIVANKLDGVAEACERLMMKRNE